MKTKLIYLLAFTLVFMGCESDDTAEVVINITNGGNNNNSGAIELSGIFTEDLTLSNAEEYVVTGPVIMSDGANLIIPAGMTLPVKPVGVNAYIAIRPGSKIIADGTAANPIVLTSDAATPSSGDW